MKMSKKIFVVLLSAALLIGCISFTAFAEPVTVANYSHILDYFTEPTLFNYDFANGTPSYESSLVFSKDRTSAQIVNDASAPNGKYIKVSTQREDLFNALMDNVFFNWESEEVIDSFYMDAVLSADVNKKISGGATVPNGVYPKIRIAVSSSITSDYSSYTYGMDNSLVVLDFRSGDGSNANSGIGYLSYLKAETDTATGVTSGKMVTTEYKLNASNWYSISLTYDTVNSSFSLTVTNVNDPSDTITLSDGYVSVSEIKSVRIGSYKQDSDGKTTGGNVLEISKLVAAGGTVRRELNDANREAALRTAIIETFGHFNNNRVSIEDKIGMCNVINSIVRDHGYTSNDESVNAALLEFQRGGVGLYGNEIAKIVESYSALTDYTERRELIDTGVNYADILEGSDLTVLKPDEISVILSDIATVRAEDESLKALKADCDAFVEALKDIGDAQDSTDYTVLNPYYEATKDLTVDMTYAGVAECYPAFVKVNKTCARIISDGEEFLATMAIASDEGNTFRTRYDAYISLDLTINTTYTGVIEAMALYTETVNPYMEELIGYAESFLMYVNKADYAVYLSAKQENLDLSEEFIDKAPADFPGVEEAKALKLSIQSFIDEQKNNAKLYIDAVNALAGLSGADLVLGIEKANELKAAGNVLGVDGVTEANITLDQLVASIELPDKYSMYYIRLVDAIDDADTAESWLKAVKEAKAAEINANQNYYGVSEAYAVLAEAISEFNALAADINATFAAANAVAVNTFGSTSRLSAAVVDAPVVSAPRHTASFGDIVESIFMNIALIINELEADVFGRIY